MWNFLTALAMWEIIKKIWPTLCIALGFIFPFAIPDMMNNRLVQQGYIDFQWWDLFFMAFSFNLGFEAQKWMQKAVNAKHQVGILPENPTFMDRVTSLDGKLSSAIGGLCAILGLISAITGLGMHFYYYIMY